MPIHRRPSRRGFFVFFFGTRLVRSKDTARPLEMRCPSCGNTTRFAGSVYRNWLTIFFVPVFPISGRQRVSECTGCRAIFRVPLEQLHQHAAGAEQAQFQEAIALYNRLRDNPTDSVLLYQLMQMYAGMGEPEQAASAARYFPDALRASSQCQELLARIGGAGPSASPEDPAA